VVNGAHDLKEKAKGRAEELADKAREGYEKGEQKIKRAVDDGVDVAGEVKERAAGVISRLEETLESVSRTVTDALQDFVEGDTERVWLAPPTNTEDVLRMRQNKRLQDQGMDRQVDRMVSTLSDELTDVVEGRRADDYIWAMPPSNTEDVLQMRAQANVNNQMDRRFF
jgi:flagellar biosynthesis/type III secretory pathway protein FliH